MEVIRPAGYNERRCIAREQLRIYGTIVSVATYSGPSTRSLQQTIIPALQQTILDHPALSSVILDARTKQPQVARVSTLDLQEHLHFLENDTTLEQILEHALNDPIHEISTRPRWRVYVVTLPSKAFAHSFRLAYSCSHVFMDGTSLKIFQESMLRHLSTPQSNNASTDPHKTPTSQERILPPLDQAGTFPISWSFLLGPLFKEYLPGLVARFLGANTETEGQQIWQGASAKPALPEAGSLISTNLCAITISVEVLNRALSACKVHGARLTGLLNLCAARALAEALQQRGQQWRQFQIANPLDMRRPLQQGEGKMTNYVSSCEEVLIVDLPYDSPFTEEDWATVRGSTEKLSKASATLSDQPVALLGYLSDFPGWVKKKAITPAEGSFEVSNIGVIDERLNELPGGWQIDEISFASSADGTGGPFNLDTVSVKGGPLGLTMSWWPGMLGVGDEATFAREVCSGIERQLRSVASE